MTGRLFREPGALDARTQAFFRFREVGEKVLLTNQEGDFVLLREDELGLFARGDLDPASALYDRLRRHNFLREHYDLERAAEKLRARKAFLGHGPPLHVMVVTLRSNETCVYRRASRADLDAVQTDMTTEIAERSVDIALASTSPSITIEFRGGEPLLNFPVVTHVIEYALEKNRALGKRLSFAISSNLALLDEGKLAYLLQHEVEVSTSIDGPRPLHDKLHQLLNRSSYDESTRWMARINAEALLTTTRESLPHAREIVDTYVSLGCRTIFLRPLDPIGLVEETRSMVEYARHEYMIFYRHALDYLIELNLRGAEILERYAAGFLTKILRGEDASFLDVRSPCGAGVGQLAYDYDGRVYSSDEGRLLAAAGDEAFLIGDVRKNTYREIVGHETVRALVIASNLDGQPDCVHCTYLPYCGTTPEHNYVTLGSIFGRMRESTLCAVHKGIQDYLFEKIGEDDPNVMDVFRRWVTASKRS